MSVSYKKRTILKEETVANDIGLRKEFVKKQTLQGYSGNCNDFINFIINMVTKPIETGYYMDKNLNFYKWNRSTKKFQKIDRQENGLLCDYDLKCNNKVIRTNYDGYGLNLV